jgi:Ca2+:H+ antiporter
MRGLKLEAALRREWALPVSVATCLLFLLLQRAGLQEPTGIAHLILLFAVLLTVLLGASLAVVRHADQLAARLGEPYGTMVLTLSVTTIEVATITAVMLHGNNNPTLARDTLIAVIMIILNGMVGLSLLVGGWRYREQHYNLQGANAYLGLIIPLSVLSLILPDYTVTTAGPTLSAAQEIFLILVSVGLYAAFVLLQANRHSAFFTVASEAVEPEDEPHSAAHIPGSTLRSALLLLAYLLPVVYLAEKLAVPIDYVIETLQAPAAFGGVIVAVLVATPEAISAVRAAAGNHVQRSVNIFLGSVLSTIGLTIPAMLVISHLTGHAIELGVQHTDIVMVLLTLATSVVTFSSGRTNVLQGGVHLLLFAAYLFLIVQG